MEKSDVLISYEGVKQSFEGDIAISGGRILGGVRVSLKALRIYLNGVRSKIEALPRVEIVHCEECAHRNTWRCIVNYGADELMDMDPGDFCSWGKRRQDDEIDRR